MPRRVGKRRTDTPAELSLFRLWLGHAKVSVGVALSGLVVLTIVAIAHASIGPRMDPFVWTLIASVGASLLPTGVVTVIYQWFMLKDREQSHDYVRSAFFSGVLVLANHQKAPNRREMLLPARRRVRVMTTTLFQYFQVVGTLPEEKAREGVSFQFILYDPDTEGIGDKAREEGRDLQVFRHEIITTCEQHLGPLQRQYPGQIRVRFCKSNTPFGITIIDEQEMIVSLNIPGLSRVRKETPCLIIQNRYDPASVFKLYERSFNALWDSLNDRIPESVARFFEDPIGENDASGSAAGAPNSTGGSRSVARTAKPPHV